MSQAPHRLNPALLWSEAKLNIENFRFSYFPCVLFLKKDTNGTLSMHTYYYTRTITCLMSQILCRMSYVSCLMSYVSCLLSYVSCLISYVLFLMSYFSCLMSCLMSYFSCLMSCLMSYFSCLISYVSCLLLISITTKSKVRELTAALLPLRRQLKKASSQEESWTVPFPATFFLVDLQNGLSS